MLNKEDIEGDIVFPVQKFFHRFVYFHRGVVVLVESHIFVKECFFMLSQLVFYDHFEKKQHVND